MGGWVGGRGRGGEEEEGGIPKTSVSRFKFQDGGGVGGGRKVIVLIVLKARDFTPVFQSTMVVHSTVMLVKLIFWDDVSIHHKHTPKGHSISQEEYSRDIEVLQCLSVAIRCSDALNHCSIQELQFFT